MTLKQNIQELIAPDGAPKVVAYLAEFETVDAVVNAARKTKDAGFTRFDVHSPFPIHGIDAAMGIRPTILPWLVMFMGVMGLVGGLVMQWWMNAHDYPYFISGKPDWSLPANIPVIFECTILCAAYTAVFGMLALNRLPMLYNPLFKSERFRRVTADRFFLVIDAKDPKATNVDQFLTSLNPVSIETVED